METIDVRYMDQIKAFIDKVINALAMKQNLLFFSLLLSKVRIYYVNTDKFVACSGNFEIYLSKRFFEEYHDSDKLRILIHELLHIILRHSDRMQKYMSVASRKYPLPAEDIKMIYNMVADFYIDCYLNPFDRRSYKYFVPYMEINTQSIKLMKWKRTEIPVSFGKQSIEEITEDILRAIFDDSEPPQDIGVLGFKQDEDDNKNFRDIIDEGENMSEGAVVVREGISPLPSSEQEIQNEIMKSSKMAGMLPGQLAEEIHKLNRAILPWRRMVRETLGHKITDIRRTFSRPNRRYDWLPRYKFEYGGSALIMIDTSGSITTEDLEQFLGEVYECLKHGLAVVMTWDTEIHDIFILEKRDDIRNVKIRGRGGTRITEPLKKAKELMTPSDVLVILSDFYISEPDYQLEQMLKDIPGKKVLATTQRVPKINSRVATVYRITFDS